MSEGLLTRLGPTYSVDVPVGVGDSLARVGLAMGAATALSFVIVYTALHNNGTFGGAVTS